MLSPFFLEEIGSEFAYQAVIFMPETVFLCLNKQT